MPLSSEGFARLKILNGTKDEKVMLFGYTKLLSIFKTNQLLGS